MNLEQWVDELFEVFDTNKDGVISRDEFAELIQALLREKGVKMSDTIFERFDSDHDNVISKAELTEMVIDLAL